MSDSALVIGTIYSAPQSQESNVAANTAQEIVFESKSSARDYMIASEKSLMRIWMTHEEDQAWKDL
jgi:hypothetical protein